MGKLTCVYCLEKFKRSEIKFRCLQENPSLCKPEPDEHLQRYLGLTTPKVLPKVISANSSWRRFKEVKCSCGYDTKPVCPWCHNDLPHQFGLTKSCTIALIGAKEVGKSHYVAVLIHELKNRIGIKFNAVLNALDDQTTKRYNEDFKRYIYDRKEVIPGTLTAKAVDATVRYPLVYRLNLESKNILGLKSEREVTMVFYDTAGEDLTNLDIMKTENKYIANADGLIFLLDPLQIPAVSDALPSSIPLPTENTNQEDIINRAIILIQTICNLKPTDKINIPVAVAFSKMDTLHAIVDPVLLRASNHNGYFDITDTEMVNDLFTGYLEKWVGANMLKLVEKYFKIYSFFGLSALGSSPDQTGKLAKGVSPFRIEDPLLWILYKKGIIKAKRV